MSLSPPNRSFQRHSASVRPATVDDLAPMLAIEKAVYPRPWDQKHFEQEMEKKFSRVLVLTDDETDTLVLGYIVYWVQVEGVSLHNIAVSPSWRGLGFGEKLMRIMINETVRDEIPKVIIEVRPSNSGALSLYEKLGFQKTHTRKKFYQDGEDAWVFELKTSELSGVVQ